MKFLVQEIIDLKLGITIVLVFPVDIFMVTLFILSGFVDHQQ